MYDHYSASDMHDNPERETVGYRRFRPREALLRSALQAISEGEAFDLAYPSYADLTDGERMKYDAEDGYFAASSFARNALSEIYVTDLTADEQDCVSEDKEWEDYDRDC